MMMEEYKGTPGPWHWNEEGLGNKHHIVFGKEYPIEMTRKADKSLITAAPELLEELIETHSALCFTPDYIGSLRYLKNKEVIAKALGK